MRVFAGIEEFASSAGQELGTSEWVPVDQQRIDVFAEATGDRQWIHVDAERAQDGPFGATIAHGYLTLSLLPVFHHDVYRVDNVAMAVNYGLDKVRFVAPVRSGSRVRGAVTLADVTRLEGAVQGTLSTVVEIEGSGKPAAVVTSIVRLVG